MWTTVNGGGGGGGGGAVNDWFSTLTSDFVLKLRLLQQVKPKDDETVETIRMVQLCDVFDYERHEPSYSKLIQRIVSLIQQQQGFDDEDNISSSKNFEVTYRDAENDAVHLSSSSELAYAIQQAKGGGQPSLLLTIMIARKSKKFSASTSVETLARRMDPFTLQVKQPRNRAVRRHKQTYTDEDNNFGSYQPPVIEQSNPFSNQQKLAPQTFVQREEHDTTDSSSSCKKSSGGSSASSDHARHRGRPPTAVNTSVGTGYVADDEDDEQTEDLFAAHHGFPFFMGVGSSVRPAKKSEFRAKFDDSSSCVALLGDEASRMQPVIATECAVDLPPPEPHEDASSWLDIEAQGRRVVSLVESKFQESVVSVWGYDGEQQATPKSADDSSSPTPKLPVESKQYPREIEL